MVQKLILTGTADKGNGDPLRTAFIKVNDNFTELFNHVSAGVAAGATAPTDPGEGDLWWDSTSGRLYVYYGTAWVDASPEDGAGISSTNELVNGAHTVSLASTGVLTLPGDTTISDDGMMTFLEKRLELTTTEGEITTVDAAGSQLYMALNGTGLICYDDPDGPNNTAQGAVRVVTGGAIIEGTSQSVGATEYGRVSAANNGIIIAQSDGVLTSTWAFEGTELMYGSNNGSYIIDGADNNFEVRTSNNIVFEANNEVDIYTRDGEKQWIFNNNGDLVLPAKWPVSFTAVFDADHYTGDGTFTGDGTASLTVALAGSGTEFAWAADDPTYETDLGYVGQQQFSFTAADHGITGYTLDIVMEMISGEGYSIQPALSEPPSVVDLAKIRSSEELMIKAGAKGWLFDVQGNIYLPPNGSVRDRDSKLAFNENGGTNVYLTPTTDDSTAVFINTTSIQNYATESVSLQVGSAAADLEDLWIGAEAVWVDTRDQDAAMAAPVIRPWDGLPSYTAYDVIVNAGTQSPPAPSNLPQVANDAKNAYATWQLALGNVSGVSISASSNEWIFNPSGILTLNNGVAEIYADPIDGSVRISNAGELTAPSIHLTLGGVDTILTIQGGPPSKIWTFTGAGGLTFPDSTIQTTAYPGITNSAGPSATIAVGNGPATRDQLSVRVSNNADTLDVEINYSNPDSQVAVSAYKSYPVAANIYSGRIIKLANNTTWDLVGNLSLAGDSLSFTFTDHSYLKMYRVTVVADAMPGGGALGEAFCIIEELK